MIKSNFYTTLFLPSLKKNIKIKEINNYYYIDILKFIQNNSLFDLVNYFDHVISENTDSEIKNLSNLDKFCILLEMRSISLGNIIEFYIDNTHVKYNLFDICKNIQNLNLKNETISIGDLIFELSLPKKFILDANEDIIQKCILKINDLDCNLISEDEKDALYKMIPASVYTDIKQFIINNTNYIEEKNIFNTELLDTLKDFKINPFNNSLIEFIKAIYNDNLMNFYELQFNLITKMNISYDHFMSMTFNESRMYVAMQNKDTKKQEEAQKKSQGNLPL
jgi:hypothetical protein